MNLSRRIHSALIAEGAGADGKRQKQPLNVGSGIMLGVAIGMFMDNIAMGIRIGLARAIALSWEVKKYGE